MDWEKRRLTDATQAWLLSGAVVIDAASYFSLCLLVICLPHRYSNSTTANTQHTNHQPPTDPCFLSPVLPACPARPACTVVSWLNYLSLRAAGDPNPSQTLVEHVLSVLPII